VEGFEEKTHSNRERRSSMEHLRIKKLVLSGLMAALVIVMTMLVPIKIPVPIQGAYIHPGDSMIYLSGYLLGGPIAAVVGGIGSAIADTLVGANEYIFATLLIKALMGYIAGKLLFRMETSCLWKGITGMLLSSIWMVLGYFGYEYIAFGIGKALPSIPFNILQAAAGIVLTIPILAIIQRIPYLQRIRRG